MGMRLFEPTSARADRPRPWLVLSEMIMKSHGDHRRGMVGAERLRSSLSTMVMVMVISGVLALAYR
jgi:hypothetical protein